MTESTGIFISYRRDDTQGWAVVLRDRLVTAFGEDRVFFAPDTLVPGLWRKQIEEALAESKVVLVVIGERWLTLADNAGEPRLLQRDDVHRQEIEMALSRPAIIVVPVLVDGVTMPRREDLPASIAALADLQALQLSDVNHRRRGDLQAIISHIEHLTGLTANPEISGSRRWWALLGVLLATFITWLVLMVAAQVVFGWSMSPDESTGILVIVLAFFSIITLWRARARVARKHAAN